MQRPRFDLREVLHERTLLGDVLDAAHQARERRIGVLYDRRALFVFMRDDDIDRIAPQQVRGRVAPGAKSIAALGGIAHEIVLGSGQICADLGQLRKLRADIVERRLDRRPREILVQIRDVLTPQPVGRRRLGEIGFELLLQAVDAGFDFAAHVVRKLVEHLGLHHLAAVHGRHAEA